MVKSKREETTCVAVAAEFSKVCIWYLCVDRYTIDYLLLSLPSPDESWRLERRRGGNGGRNRNTERTATGIFWVQRGLCSMHQLENYSLLCNTTMVSTEYKRYKQQWNDVERACCNSQGLSTLNPSSFFGETATAVPKKKETTISWDVSGGSRRNTG